jgi:hypothetical protein
MSTASRWASQRVDRVAPTTTKITKPVEAPAPAVKVEPLAPAAAESEPPAPLPRVVKQGRGRKKKTQERLKRGTRALARSFTFPLTLLERLEHFAVGHAERTATRFNYSAYMVTILDADLRKRGF